MDFSKIEKLMTDNKISAYQLSKKIGIPASSITAWKKGKYNPGVNSIKKIAEYFGVTVDYFL